MAERPEVARTNCREWWARAARGAERSQQADQRHHGNARATAEQDKDTAMAAAAAEKEAAEANRAVEECLDGTLTRAGVRRFNARLLAVVDKWNSAHADGNGAGGAAVAVVDGFGITDGQCEWTADGDGRHYPGLIPLELHALFDHLLRQPD